MGWASEAETDSERVRGRWRRTGTNSHNIHFVVVFICYYGNVNENLTMKLFALM